MLLRFFYCILTLPFLLAGTGYAGEKIIISQGSTIGGLIENTLAATTLAIASEIDFLELQVIMTADDHLLVFQNLTFNGLTDVAEIFPGRSRKNGNYFAMDFTLPEIRQLRVTQPFGTDNYPLSSAIPTLAEELGLIRRLEEQLKRPISITIEIKHPWFHRDADKDISTAVLDTLTTFGYTNDADTLFLQSFDPEELQRIHSKLLPERQMNIPLIQLIGFNDGQETRQLNVDKWEPYNYDWLFTNIGLRMVAIYASAIALPKNLIADEEGTILLPQYIQDIHKHGLHLFTYSLNNRPEDLPPFTQDFSSLLDFYFSSARIDGVYTTSFAEIQHYLVDKAERQKKKDDLPPFFSTLELSRPSAEKTDPND